MSHWTPTRSTASARCNEYAGAPPSRAYQNAFGNTTPTSARKAGISLPAQASPQVKQRLAELRKAKLAGAAKNNNHGSIDGSFESATTLANGENQPVDSASIRRPPSSASSFSLESTLASCRTPSPAVSEITIELGIRSVQEEVERAQKSGRLNIAGRSLEELPPLVLDQLLPQSSVYHPSNTGPPAVYSLLAQKTANIDLSGNDRDDNTEYSGSPATPWWEMESLTTLKASSNELTTIPAALAGFESLEILDLHANKLSVPFPASFGTLANLTNLNLANNNIDSWPIELMALVHLKMLDLSHNRISELWGLNWKTNIMERMKDFKRDTKRIQQLARSGENGDSSFDSLDSQSTADNSSAGEDFWSAFSTAPVKTRARAYIPTKTDTDYTVALPSLTSLNLSHNMLSPDSFSASNIDSLPPALTCLDLSNNKLSGRIPLKLFSDLSRLQRLYLGENGLDDAFFIASPPASIPIFPSLVILDLSRNALDSLEYIEDVLKVPSDRQAVYSGVTSPSLVKALAAPAPATSRYPPVHIDLNGNLMREELSRRKQIRREKRQESNSDAKLPRFADSTSKGSNEAVQVLRMLDEVHQSLSGKLGQGQVSLDNLSEIKALLERLRMLAEKPVERVTETQISPSSKVPVTEQVCAVSNESQTPVKTIIQEMPGSSRARKLRMQQEAQQWAPL